jgi:16S rRNA (cytosine967-C5)-methyltransferase
VSVEKPREIAARVLLRWRAGRDYVENLLDRELESHALSAADRGLLQELVCGAVRWQATLDWLIARKTGGRHQKDILQVLLRLGLYQLFWLDRIPDHAGVSETVELAKRFGCGPQAGFVNALLRGCLRERDTLRRALLDLKATQVAVGYSHPAWLCERWHKLWGEDALRQLLDWNNTPPRTWARANLLRTSRQGLLDLWAEEGVQFTPHTPEWAGDLLVGELDSPRPVAKLGSFRRGCFYVQDASTLLAPRTLNPQPGEAVLDFCAAPGGKTTLLAQLMQNQGRILAHDTDPQRLAMLRDNCLRLGATCVEPITPGELNAESCPRVFDRVLVDAPCSNTGVMRRRVDLRWRLEAEAINRLRAIQTGILGQAALRVRPGGVLVYSTCSLEPEENEEVVRMFLDTNREFRLQFDRSLRPFADGVDGAYVARLLREGDAKREA